MKHIVVIGGGFTGSVLAINLGRFSSSPLAITVVDKSKFPCRGVAYSTFRKSHFLNVVARNMSALADRPTHFAEWLATRSEYLATPIAELREKFIPRSIYGDYIHNLYQFFSGNLTHDKGMNYSWENDEVIDIIPQSRGLNVVLASGRTLQVDKVVLAMGNQLPSSLPVPHGKRYIPNPWDNWTAQLPNENEDVLLVGTGLTMADVFLSLRDLGWKGKIWAISRHGKLPLAHFKGFDHLDQMETIALTEPLRKIYRAFKQQYRAAVMQGINPAVLADKMRPYTQAAWQRLTLKEKRQFYRHLRGRWNTLRHRMPAEIYDELIRAIKTDQLQILRGKISTCHETEKGLTISVKGPEENLSIHAGIVINCTGPNEAWLPRQDGLFHKLTKRGMIVADDMNMGIQADSNFSVVDASGTSSQNFYAIGSILKGTLWESTAVPEMRSQAFRLAKFISDQNASEGSSIHEVFEDILEYSI